jgi:hypothetical protein
VRNVRLTANYESTRKFRGAQSLPAPSGLLAETNFRSRAGHLEIAPQFIADKTNRLLDFDWCLLRLDAARSKDAEIRGALSIYNEVYPAFDPKTTGFGVFMLKAVLSGRGDEIVDLAKVNLFR